MHIFHEFINFPIYFLYLCVVLMANIINVLPINSTVPNIFMALLRVMSFAWLLLMAATYFVECIGYRCVGIILLFGCVLAVLRLLFFPLVSVLHALHIASAFSISLAAFLSLAHRITQHPCKSKVFVVDLIILSVVWPMMKLPCLASHGVNSHFAFGVDFFGSQRNFSLLCVLSKL